MTVADARFAKPLDAELVRSLVAEHELLVTIEENQLAGGFGSGVVELPGRRGPAGRRRVMRVGLPDRFVTHGKPALLRKEVGLTPEAIAERVTQAVGDRSTALRLEPQAIQDAVLAAALGGVQRLVGEPDQHLACRARRRAMRPGRR